jgi:hypothetical protein
VTERASESTIDMTPALHRHGPARSRTGVRITQMGYEFWLAALEATIRRAWE